MKRQTERQDLLEQAERFEQSGEWNRAVQIYRRMVKTEKNPAVWGAYAWGLLGNRQFKEALEAAKKMAVLLKKHSSPTLLASVRGLIGYVHHCAGRRVLAERYYRQSIEQYPRAEIYVLLGTLLREQEKNIEAKVCYQKALEIEPRYVEARYNLALWYRRHHDMHRAAEHLRKVLEINPSYAPALSLYATVLWQEGGKGIDEAKKRLHQALRLQPGRSESHVFLAYCLISRGKIHLAKQQLQQAIDKLPDNSTLWWSYGWLLGEFFDDAEQAEVCFRRALELNPRDGLGYFYFAEFLQHRERFSEARAALQKAADMGVTKAREPREA